MQITKGIGLESNLYLSANSFFENHTKLLSTIPAGARQSDANTELITVIRKDLEHFNDERRRYKNSWRHINGKLNVLQNLDDDDVNTKCDRFCR